MCGRLYFFEPELIAAHFESTAKGIELRPTYNGAPSQPLLVVVERADGLRETKLMHWGLIPRWKGDGPKIPPPINARSETVAEKAMFKRLLAMRRCLVPANGFYEWRAGGERKQPYAIHPTDRQLFAFAGLWDDTRPEGAPEGVSGSFTIITTAANEFMSELHHRMPVILDRDEEALWLDSGVQEPDAVLPLLDAYDAAKLEAYPVSLAVNSVRNDSPDLIAPIELEPETVQGSLF
jgi:putative SOS response-associated peptidase YedK